MSTTALNAMTTTTDEGGRFVFPIVRPDTYTLQATLSGFKTLARSSMVVNANDKLRFAVLDFKRVTHVDVAATRMLAALTVAAFLGCTARPLGDGDTDDTGPSMLTLSSTGSGP